MQPLAKLGSRLAWDSIARSTAPRSFRAVTQISRSSLIRPSVCVDCKVRFQIRSFADDSKPAGPPAQSTSSARSESSYFSPETNPERPLSTAQDAELPSAEEGRRSALSKRLEHLMDNLQGNIFIASQRLNDLTGYSGIEALKTRIQALEQHVQDCQEAVRTARARYKATVAERAASQREVTALLARKDTWSPADLERFTSLYRSDHGNEQAVQEAAQKLADAEREAENSATKLSSAILSRYHEEQIWSDKIRRMSTWGTWGLMGVNILLFLIFQLGFEPYRRRRLVRGFEDKVKEALEKEKLAQLEAHGENITTIERTNIGELSPEKIVSAGIQELQEERGEDTNTAVPTADAAIAGVEGLVNELSNADPQDTVSVEETPFWKQFGKQLGTPESWQAAAKDLFSDKAVLLKKKDLTAVALESAATGAAIVGIIAMVLLRRS